MSDSKGRTVDLGGTRGIEWAGVKCARPLRGSLGRKPGNGLFVDAAVRQLQLQTACAREILETERERLCGIFVAGTAARRSNQCGISLPRDVRVPADDLREQNGERQAVRQVVPRREWVGAGVRGAEHRLL